MDMIAANLTATNFDNFKATLFVYKEPAPSTFTNFGVNIVVCKIFEVIRIAKFSDQIYPKIRIQYFAKNLSTIDKYGNEQTREEILMNGDWRLSDVEKFNCENNPDVFTTAKNVEFFSVMETELQEDCMNKLSKNKTSWTGLCEFLN